MAWFSNWTQKHSKHWKFQNIKKLVKIPPKINVISIALNLTNWTQKHYIQNIEKLNIWKNSWKSQKNPRNFHCVEFVKFNAMEITLTFLVIFTSFFRFDTFNVLNVMFLRSVCQIQRNGNCVDYFKIISFPTERCIFMIKWNWQNYLPKMFVFRHFRVFYQWLWVHSL